MGTKRQKPLSIRAQRQIQILKRHHDVDEENRLITISFHYSKVSEILESNVDVKSPVLNYDVLRKISITCHSIPSEFKLDIDLDIDDYEGYDPNDIAAAIKDAFELYKYDISLEKDKNSGLITKLALIGVFALAAIFFFKSKDWFGPIDDVDREILHELIYAIAISVLWECVYLILLPKDHFNKISFSMFNYLNKFTLYDSNRKEVASPYTKDSAKEWVTDTKIESISRALLIGGSTTFIALAEITTFTVINAFVASYNSADGISWFPIILNVLLVIYLIVAGISGLNFSKRIYSWGLTSIIMGSIAFIFAILDIFALIDIANFVGPTLVYLILFFLVATLYTFSAVMLYRRTKKYFKKDPTLKK